MDSAVIVPGPDNAQVGQDMSCDARYTSVLAHPTPQASVEPAPRSTARNVECDSHRAFHTVIALEMGARPGDVVVR